MGFAHGEDTKTWRLAEMSVMTCEAVTPYQQGALVKGNLSAGGFLRCGVDRWEKEGRLAAGEAQALRDHLTSGAAQDALRHLGVHLALSVPIPVPGLQNLARLAWTAAFWGVAQWGRFRHRAPGSSGRLPNIHSPLVMAISIIPVLGSFAYLAARPLRNRLLIRLALDQVAWKLPFRLYGRIHLDRWLAPGRKHEGRTLLGM